MKPQLLSIVDICQ